MTVNSSYITYFWFCPGSPHRLTSSWPMALLPLLGSGASHRGETLLGVCFFPPGKWLKNKKHWGFVPTLANLTPRNISRYSPHIGSRDILWHVLFIFSPLDWYFRNFCGAVPWRKASEIVPQLPSVVCWQQMPVAICKLCFPLSIFFTQSNHLHDVYVYIHRPTTHWFILEI